jgi:hypothetical protein
MQIAIDADGTMGEFELPQNHVLIGYGLTTMIGPDHCMRDSNDS